MASAETRRVPGPSDPFFFMRLQHFSAKRSLNEGTLSEYNWLSQHAPHMLEAPPPSRSLSSCRLHHKLDSARAAAEESLEALTPLQRRRVLRRMLRGGPPFTPSPGPVPPAFCFTTLPE